MARLSLRKRKGVIKKVKVKRMNAITRQGRIGMPNGDLYIVHPIGEFMHPSEAKKNLRELFPNIEAKWNNGEPSEYFNPMQELALVALGAKPLCEVLFDVPYDEYDYNPYVIWLCQCAGVISTAITSPMNPIMYDIGPKGLVIVQGRGPFKETPCGLKYERIQNTLWFRPENYYRALLYNAMEDAREGGADYEERKWSVRLDVAPFITRFPEILRAILLGYTKRGSINAIPNGYDNIYLRTGAVSRITDKTPSIDQTTAELRLTNEQIQEYLSSIYDELSVQIAAVKKGFEESD